MKVPLARIPGERDLKGAYEALLHARDSAPSLQALALWTQWARFDARLGEILVGTILLHWERLNPVELNQLLLLQPWPAAAAVLLEFVTRAIPREKRAVFKLWKSIVTQGFKKAQWEQFFIGQTRIGGKFMIDDARFSLSEYRRWGYLSREILFNKQLLPASARSTGATQTHSLDIETRAEVLKELLHTQPRISTLEYWNAINRSISRRQAERDLRDSALLRPVGRTKGRFFVRRRTSAKTP